MAELIDQPRETPFTDIIIIDVNYVVTCDGSFVVVVGVNYKIVSQRLNECTHQ